MEKREGINKLERVLVRTVVGNLKLRIDLCKGEESEVQYTENSSELKQSKCRACKRSEL